MKNNEAFNRIKDEMKRLYQLIDDLCPDNKEKDEALNMLSFSALHVNRSFNYE
jgi:hypothetical protein